MEVRETPQSTKDLPRADWSCGDAQNSQACNKLLDEVHGMTLSPEARQQALSKYGVPASTENKDGSVTTHELSANGGIKEFTRDPNDRFGFYNKDAQFFKDPGQNHSVEKYGDSYIKTEASGVKTAYRDSTLTDISDVVNPDQTGYQKFKDANGKDIESHFGPAKKDNYWLYGGDKEAGQNSLQFSNIYKEVAPSTAQITARNPETLNRFGAGSAVMVEKTSENGCLAVTADHVVRTKSDDPSQPGLKPALKATSVDGSVHDMEVLARDPGKDLALVSIKDAGAQCSPAKFAGNKPEVGDNVVHVGYPSSDKSNNATVIPGKVTGVHDNGCTIQGSAKAGTTAFDSEQTKFAVAAKPGMSGGPVVNKEGRLVGLSDAASTEDNPLQSTCSVFLTQKDVDDLRRKVGKH